MSMRRESKSVGSAARLGSSTTTSTFLITTKQTDNTTTATHRVALAPITSSVENSALRLPSVQTLTLPSGLPFRQDTVASLKENSSFSVASGTLETPILSCNSTKATTPVVHNEVSKLHGRSRCPIHSAVCDVLRSVPKFKLGILKGLARQKILQNVCFPDPSSVFFHDAQDFNRALWTLSCVHQTTVGIPFYQIDLLTHKLLADMELLYQNCVQIHFLDYLAARHCSCTNNQSGASGLHYLEEVAVRHLETMTESSYKQYRMVPCIAIEGLSRDAWSVQRTLHKKLNSMTLRKNIPVLHRDAIELIQVVAKNHKVLIQFDGETDDNTKIFASRSQMLTAEDTIQPRGGRGGTKQSVARRSYTASFPSPASSCSDTRLSCGFSCALVGTPKNVASALTQIVKLSHVLGSEKLFKKLS